MPRGSPTARQVVAHAVAGAAICFAGFWLADITGMVSAFFRHAAGEKWMVVAVACSYCSVGAALTGVIFPAPDH